MRITTLFLLLIFPFLLIGQQLLIPHQQGSLWGYIDMNTKEVVVPYQYDEVMDLDRYDYLKVRKENYWGLLFANGKEALPIKYDSLAWINKPVRSHFQEYQLLTKLNGKCWCLSRRFI